MDEQRIIELFLRTRSEETFCELFAVLYLRMHRYFRLCGMDPMMAEDLAYSMSKRSWRELLAPMQRTIRDSELTEAGTRSQWVNLMPDAAHKVAGLVGIATTR